MTETKREGAEDKGKGTSFSSTKKTQPNNSFIMISLLSIFDCFGSLNFSVVGSFAFCVVRVSIGFFLVHCACEYSLFVQQKKNGFQFVLTSMAIHHINILQNTHMCVHYYDITAQCLGREGERKRFSLISERE